MAPILRLQGVCAGPAQEPAGDHHPPCPAFIRRLAWDPRETVHLAALEGPQFLHCDKVEPPEGHPVSTAVGVRLDAHVTEVGKAVLAWHNPGEVRELFGQHSPHFHTARTISSIDRVIRELVLIRKRGYATDEGEMILGLNCAAAPIMNSIGRAVLAVSISGPASRFGSGWMAKLAARLVATVQEISEYIIEHGVAHDAE